MHPSLCLLQGLLLLTAVSAPAVAYGAGPQLAVSMISAAQPSGPRANTAGPNASNFVPQPRDVVGVAQSEDLFAQPRRESLGSVDLTAWHFDDATTPIDVFIVEVPERSTIALAFLGLASSGMFWRRRT